MKNKEERKSKIEETTPQSKLVYDDTELSLEQDKNIKMVFKPYQEPSRPYFSSPCMLSEMEDTEDTEDTFNF